MKRLISGIKPSGEPTLGNYIGAIRQFIEMQKEYESIIFIADLHSITVPIEKDELKKNIKELITIYLDLILNILLYFYSQKTYIMQI